MKRNSNNNNNILYSDNETAKKEIDRVKKNIKDYDLIVEGLLLLGNFKEKIEVHIYEIINDVNNKEVILYCEDQDDSIFTFRSLSSNKDKMKRIMKISNSSEIEYDLSLVKKHNLTIDNIELTRTGKVKNFKYGRLITDEKTFYSIFLGDDICHQIIMNFEEQITDDLTNRLNQIESKPTLHSFVKIVEELLKKELNNIDFDIYSYNSFEKVAEIISKNNKKLKLNKE